jgi:glucokinase
MAESFPNSLAACVDIGGTKALIGLVDAHGSIRARERFLVAPGRDPADLVRELVEKLRRLAARENLPWERVAGVGYSTAGMMDVQSGIIFSSPNQGSWRDVPFGALLKSAFGLPAWIEMDANAAAIGEGWMGHGAGADYFVHVIIGTGIGAGILIHDEILHGWRGTAGEFGHTIIDPDGPPCNCGGRGCLESLASGPAIALRAEQAAQTGRPTVLSGKISTEAVFAAARGGDALALQVVADTVTYLSIGLTNLIHLLNPKVITIGGGVGVGGADLLLDPLRAAVRSRVGSWVDFDGTCILPARLGEEAGLLGASRLVWKGLKSTSG